MSELDRELDHLALELRSAWEILEKTCEALGCPIFLVEGRRSMDRQSELYLQGRTTPGPGAVEIALERAPLAALRFEGRAYLPLGKPVTTAQAGESDHNPGRDGRSRALDFAFAFRDGDPWDEAHPWELVGRLAEYLGLAWGGRWPSRDRPHLYTEEA